jgi:hypothetical protein
MHLQGQGTQEIRVRRQGKRGGHHFVAGMFAEQGTPMMTIRLPGQLNRCNGLPVASYNDVLLIEGGAI